ncbi:hypothetical protein PINS_up021530 [Pythium insidiosum]|nr:hypothetical protein PINS_up021530 [Pythium insidiosum]
MRLLTSAGRALLAGQPVRDYGAGFSDDSWGGSDDEDDGSESDSESPRSRQPASKAAVGKRDASTSPPAQSPSKRPRAQDVGSGSAKAGTPVQAGAAQSAGVVATTGTVVPATRPSAASVLITKRVDPMRYPRLVHPALTAPRGFPDGIPAFDLHQPIVDRYRNLRGCRVFTETYPHLDRLMLYTPVVRAGAPTWRLADTDLRFSGAETMGTTSTLDWDEGWQPGQPQPRHRTIAIVGGLKTTFQSDRKADPQTPYFPNYLVHRNVSKEVLARYEPETFDDIVELRAWDDLWRGRVTRLYFTDPAWFSPATSEWIQSIFRAGYLCRQAMWDWLNSVHIGSKGLDDAWHHRYTNRNKLYEVLKHTWVLLEKLCPPEARPIASTLWHEPALWFRPVHKCAWVPVKEATPDLYRDQLEVWADAEPLRVRYGGGRASRFVESLDPTLHKLFALTHRAGISWQLPMRWGEPAYEPGPTGVPCVGTPGPDFYSMDPKFGSTYYDPVVDALKTMASQAYRVSCRRQPALRPAFTAVADDRHEPTAASASTDREEEEHQEEGSSGNCEAGYW